MTQALLELDLHGCTVFQAEAAINAALRKSGELNHIRLIHGWHTGTALRDFIWKRHWNHPKMICSLYDSRFPYGRWPWYFGSQRCALPELTP